MVVLTSEAQAELLWWARTAKTYNSAPPVQRPPDLVIEMDAPLSGCGDRCQELCTGGLWSVEEQKMHINTLELLSVFFAIKTFSKGKDCCNIQTDNMTAKAYINHRGTHLQTLNSMATQLWKWCLDHQVHLIVEYIPPRGEEQDCRRGVQGDKGSLRLDDPSTSFQSDKHEMRPTGGRHVCLQAQPLNSEVFQLGLDPAAEGVDAFSQDGASL